MYKTENWKENEVREDVEREQEEEKEGRSSRMLMKDMKKALVMKMQQSEK